MAKSKEAVNAALQASRAVDSDDPVEDFAVELAKSSQQGRKAKKTKAPARGSQQAATEENHAGWQGIEPLLKLHDLATWVRSSSIHADKWRRDVNLQLGVDNATRWSSWYHVLNRAIRKKSEITNFLLNHDQELSHVLLSSSQSELLSKTHDFLQPLASATVYAEGGHSSVSQALGLMDVLLAHYEEAKIEHCDEPRMLRAIEMGWFVLDKYYSNTEHVPVYAASVLLDPTKRLEYLQQNWDAAWHKKAIQGALDIWEAEYEGLATPQPPEPAAQASSPKKKTQDNQLAKLMRKTAVRKRVKANQDDLNIFIRADPIDTEVTPLQWWCRLEQRSQYPRLSQMAIDILSIPAESSEAERAFSGARRTASWDRLRMSCKSLEKVECIGSWLREGLIVPSADNGLGLACGLEPMDHEIQVDPALEDEMGLEDI